MPDILALLPGRENNLQNQPTAEAPGDGQRKSSSRIFSNRVITVGKSRITIAERISKSTWLSIRPFALDALIQARLEAGLSIEDLLDGLREQRKRYIQEKYGSDQTS